MRRADSDREAQDAVKRNGAPAAPAASGEAALLDLDPDLALVLAKADRKAVQRKVGVPTVILGPGEWSEELSDPALFGVLVVDGALVRRLVVGPGSGLEVLTPGDLARPWLEEARAGWYASLGSSRVAVLERDFAARIARWPALVEALLERAQRRIDHLADQAALHGTVGIERRVLLTLWGLAERCGLETEEGVIVPLPLTHQMLAALVGAQRPGVSAAISRLAAAGAIARTEDRGWLLDRRSADTLAEAERAASDFAGE
jgi:hypothetical protein